MEPKHLSRRGLLGLLVALLGTLFAGLLSVPRRVMAAQRPRSRRPHERPRTLPSVMQYRYDAQNRLTWIAEGDELPPPVRPEPISDSDGTISYGYDLPELPPAPPPDDPTAPPPDPAGA